MHALTHVAVLLSTAFVAAQQPDADKRDADPSQVMQHARTLAGNGQHEEALAELLWCFDYGAKENPAFVGVRLSFLPVQIAELGKKYPPALDALRERRDTAEQRAAKTKGTNRYMMDVMELAALDHYLGNDAANLELYDELKSESPDSPILKFLGHHVVDELIKAGREDEAREVGAAKNKSRRAVRKPVDIERAWPRDASTRLIVDSAIRPTTAYALDSVQYEQELSASRSEEERLSVLKRRWDAVVLAATYCDVVTSAWFHQSVQNWQSGWLITGTWTVRADGDLNASHDALSKATFLVTGDCEADVSVTENGIVHIYGDLRSTLTISGQSEVVIGGDITEDAVIEGDGILRVFVGGNMDGRIVSKGGAMLWINGDVSGSVHTGRPITKLHVIGDFFGQLMPSNVAHLAYLDVRGAMASELVAKTAGYGWSEFNASIGISDVSPGLYTKNRMSSARWVVHANQP